MNRVSVAALRIVYEAVFAAEEFPHPEAAMAELKVARSDFNDLLQYANAISSNVCDGAYYEQLSSQLRAVILERDLARLYARHNHMCKVASGGWVPMGRGVRLSK